MLCGSQTLWSAARSGFHGNMRNIYFSKVKSRLMGDSVYERTVDCFFKTSETGLKVSIDEFRIASSKASRVHLQSLELFMFIYVWCNNRMLVLKLYNTNMLPILEYSIRLDMSGNFFVSHIERCISSLITFK